LFRIYLIIILFCINLFANNYIKDVEYYIDSKNLNYNIEQIKNKNFKKSKSKYLNFGHTSDTVWIKITVDKKIAGDFVFDYGFYIADYLNFYLVKNEKIVKSSFLGNRRIKNDSNNTFLFPFKKLIDEDIKIYMKIKSSHRVLLSFNLFKKKDFNTIYTYKNTFTIIFFTTLSVILIYNFIIYLVTRKKLFRFHIIYIFSNIVMWLAFSGYSSIFLNQNFYFLNDLFFHLSVLLYHIYLVKFTNILLASKHNTSIFKILNFLTYKILVINTSICIILSLWFEAYEFIINYIIIFNLYFILFITLIISIQSFIKQKNKLIKFFSTFWIIKILISLTFMINIVNTFFEMNILVFILLVSIIFEVITMSVIIGYYIKINELKQQRIKSFSKRQKKIILENYKVSSLNHSLASIKHQIKQPLNLINAIPFSLISHFKENKLSDDLLMEKSDLINQQILYINETIDTFISLIDEPKKIVNIEKKIKKVLELYSSEIVKYNIDIRLISNSIANFCISEKNLIHVFVILLNNSIDALKQKKQNRKITITIKKEKNKSVFKIVDNSNSFNLDEVDIIFSPKFTTKQNNDLSNGYGLFLAKTICKSNNLTISCKKENKSLEFKVKEQ